MNNSIFENLQTIEQFCGDDPHFSQFIEWHMKDAQDLKHEVNTRTSVPMNRAFFRFGNSILISSRIFNQAFDSYINVIEGEYELLDVEPVSA